LRQANSPPGQGKNALSLSIFRVQVLWTLTFASLLVLLVVLLGRDRAKRLPFFTLSIAVAALRLLVSRLLYNRLSPLALSIIFFSLAILAGACQPAGGGGTGPPRLCPRQPPRVDCFPRF